jgi:hypothetical protein
MAAGEFVPQDTNTSHCSDQQTFGNYSSRYDYVVKGITGDDNYPSDACDPWLHYNMRIGNVQVDQNITAGGVIQAPTFVGNINVQSWKGFDIKHPNKQNHRLRHICLEGPEGGIYFRGRLKDSNVIELPDYWFGLIDPESITVSLTQIGSSQDLIVDKIEWGKRILIRSGTASNIDCYYVIHAARIDGEPLIVEYEGQTPADYPGSDKQYSISGYDYDARGDKSTGEEINND